jgi:hypothetical protein
MICQKTKAKLIDLLLDEQSVPTEVRKHVEQCPDCSRELESLKAAMQILDTWDAPEPSPFFDARMAARLRSEREAEPAGFFERMRARLLFGSNLQLRPVAAGALALLILIGGGTYAGLTFQPTPAANTSAAVRDLQSLDDNAQVFQQLNVLDQQDDSSDDGASSNNL